MGGPEKIRSFLSRQQQLQSMDFFISIKSTFFWKNIEYIGPFSMDDVEVASSHCYSHLTANTRSKRFSTRKCAFGKVLNRAKNASFSKWFFPAPHWRVHSFWSPNTHHLLPNCSHRYNSFVWKRWWNNYQLPALRGHRFSSLSILTKNEGRGNENCTRRTKSAESSRDACTSSGSLLCATYMKNVT